MKFSEIIKNKPPVSQAKDIVLQFLTSNTMMSVAYNKNGTASEFPILDMVMYRCLENELFIIIHPGSLLYSVFTNNSSFSGIIAEGEQIKAMKKLQGYFSCEILENDDERLKKLSEKEVMMVNYIKHGCKILKLNIIKAVVTINPAQIYSLDNNLTPTFAKYNFAGKERFENSRHVLMVYENREVIFNTIVENDTYYTLTRSDSNKMEYINNGGICEIYDGKDIHFSTKIKVIPQTQEIFDKLVQTNNPYFKENKNITALSFKKC